MGKSSFFSLVRITYKERMSTQLLQSACRVVAADTLERIPFCQHASHMADKHSLRRWAHRDGDNLCSFNVDC